MPLSLSIKKVPDEVVEKLRQRAKSHHRSLQGELLVILEEAVRDRPLTAPEVLQQARELGLRTYGEATAWIRADRDAR